MWFYEFLSISALTVSHGDEMLVVTHELNQERIYMSTLTLDSSEMLQTRTNKISRHFKGQLQI